MGMEPRIMRSYIPDRFDIAFIDMDPQLGIEITKRRPCLILTTKRFNVVSGRALICPITSTAPRNSTQISFEAAKIKGTILVDQIRSLDWRVRNAKKVDEFQNLEEYDRIWMIFETLIRDIE